MIDAFGARAAVYGDAAYGAGELLARLDNAKIHNGLKVQPASAVKGHFGIQRVPYGATLTYGDLARDLGGGTTAQEVGAAVSRNPLCIVLPRH
jgi:O6-methylguanine-DNA--protein-cysteine methyltransferase